MHEDDLQFEAIHGKLSGLRHKPKERLVDSDQVKTVSGEHSLHASSASGLYFQFRHKITYLLLWKVYPIAFTGVSRMGTAMGRHKKKKYK